MKTSAIVRIILLSLAILILTGILLGVLCFNMFIVDGIVHIDTGMNTVEPVGVATTESFSAQIRNLDIEWVAGSIIIQTNDAISEIQIEEISPVESDYQMVCQQYGQTLKIQYCNESQKYRLIGINDDDAVSKDLIITVPASWNCNTLEIDAAATEVTVSGQTINELDFDGASGKFTLENCKIVELDIDTASGDVEFSGILKSLDFDAASAKFHGEFHQVPNQLNLDAMSGDLTLVLPEYSGFYLELETLSGSFDSDFDFHTMGEHYECGDGACKIKVSAVSGDVSILKGVSTPQYAAGTECTDPNCSDPSHDHTEICNDKDCTDASHGHNNHH